MPRTQKGSNRSSNQGPGKANGKKQPKGPKGQRNQQGVPRGNIVKAPATQARQGADMRRPIERIIPGGRSLTFKEFVQDIAGSASFAVTSFPVNVGISNLFAWLAEQAGSYQEYRLTNVEFHYDTEKSSATSGKVMYAFSPDAADSAPASKQEMLEYEMKAKGAPWTPFILRLPNQKTLGADKYIRTGTLASNLDIKTYDVGILFVATQGMADTTDVGELYVSYTVELKTPVVQVHALALSKSLLVTGASPAQGSFMGTTPTVAGGLDITCSVNTLTFNRVGEYILETSLVGTGLFTSFVPVTSASTATVSAKVGISNAAANVGTNAVFVYTIVVTKRGQTAVFDCTTQSTTISASTTRIGIFAQ